MHDHCRVRLLLNESGLDFWFRASNVLKTYNNLSKLNLFGSIFKQIVVYRWLSRRLVDKALGKMIGVVQSEARHRKKGY
jgi:hypothetical protein